MVVMGNPLGDVKVVNKLLKLGADGIVSIGLLITVMWVQ